MKLNKLLFMLLVLPAIIFAQSTVTGTITDDLGGPIPGAAVVVKGTNNGTVTDFDGKYAITAKDGDILVASFAGNSVEATVSGSTIDMQIVANQIDEVIVTSMGREAKQKSLGYAVQQVKAADIQVTGSSNALQSLQGQVSGVRIQKTSGAAGGGIDILIRGMTNLNPGTDNQPLIVIDGTPIDNSTFAGDIGPSSGSNADRSSSQFSFSNRSVDINSDDVASYSVLKGAAATALYGIRAANGAILITTKRAKGGGVKVNFSTSYTSSSVNMFPELTQKWREGRYGASKITRDPSNPNITATPSYMSRQGYYFVNGATYGFHNWGPEYGDDPTMTFHDTFRDFFRTGSTKDLNANITGGSEKANVYFSFGNSKTKGIVPNTDYAKTSFKLKGNFKIIEKLSAEAQIIYSQSGGQRSTSGDKSLMSSMSYWSPTLDINDWHNPDGTQRNYTPNWIDNSRYFAELSNLNDHVSRTILIGKILYQPTDNLTFTYRANSDKYNDFRNRFVPGDLDVGTQVNGFVIDDKVVFNGFNSTFLAEYSKAISKNFNTSILVGHQIDDSKSTYYHKRGEDLINPYQNSMYNTRVQTVYDPSVRHKRIMGVFSELKADYKDIVFLSVTGRNDWASTLPKANRSFFYPSASLAIAFNDLVAKDSDKFSFGKLRLSWAQVGSVPPPNILGRYLYSNNGGFPFGSATSGTYLSSTTYDPDIHAVLSTTKEVGFDVRFMDNRFRIDYTYYDRYSEGQINYIPVANSTTASHIWANAGDIQNYGHEVLLSADILKGKKLKWNATINWSTNGGVVRSLPDGISEIIYASTGSYPGIKSAIRAGDPIGSLYGYTWRYEDGQLYIGSDGKPRIDTSQKVIVGNAFPDWVGSMTNTFNYGNFTLSANVEYKKGGSVYDSARRNSIRDGTLAETDLRYETVHLDGVTDDGSGGFMPNPASNTFVIDEGYYRSSSRYNRASEILVKDASWVKLRNISLTYNVGKNFLKKNKLTRASLSVSGSNFVLWTPYDRFDPEGNDYSSGSNIYGFTGRNIPLTQNISVGLNIGF
jgi:TonB-linked SusC/RagA family outer membrane protein